MPTFLSHEILGLITVIMTIGLHIPYFIKTYRGTIKPHPFTWILWTLLTFIIFAAQVNGNAGPGSWGTGVTAILCVGITFASFQYGFNNIHKADIFMFMAGLGAIPLWLLTNDATLAVMLATAIDLIAFAPTYRKSWHNPHEEPVYLYALNVLRHGISLAALVEFNLITATFPFAIMLANGLLAIILVVRRKELLT